MLQTFTACYEHDTYMILARDAEEAAWRALIHAQNCNWKLIDVIPTNDKTKVLP